MTKLFVSGIGTGVGKTVVSAILTELLQADYWKPVQSGDLENSDTSTVRSLISNHKTVFHPEAYRLKQALSPHRAAELEDVRIDLEKIRPPDTVNHLVIEGAGGLMVPLNDTVLMVDLIEKLGAAVVLVTQNYLGSINHTLLSVELLKSRGIPIERLIFCGEGNQSTESYISRFLNLEPLRVPLFPELSKSAIRNFAQQSDWYF